MNSKHSRQSAACQQQSDCGHKCVALLRTNHLRCHSNSLGDLLQSVLGDEAHDLPPVTWHFFVNDGHLLGAEVATCVDLLGEAAQNVGIAAAEAHAVVVACGVARLLVAGLEGVDFDQATDCPCRIGAELRLDVRLNFGFHCVQSIA